MRGLSFLEATPQVVAARLGGDSIHLWRIAYARSRGRAPLLECLGAYLQQSAAEVVLAEDIHGKPRLARADSVRDRPLQFNWSHSGDHALIALSAGQPLGVDIECLDKNLRTLEIARRFFDPAEAEALAALAPPARNHAFIELWCAKEAVLKAAGEGLSFGLGRLVFQRQNAMDWELARVEPALGHKDDWRLLSFSAVPGYHGVLAWRGCTRTVSAFQLPAPRA